MSAPIQASASVHVVPASNCVRSSTRIPESKPGDRGVTSIGGSLPEWEGGRGGSFYPRWPTGRSSTVVVVVTNTDIPAQCSRAVADARASAIIWRGAPRPRCPRRFFLRHQNRRSAHFVTHAGDDHRRRRGFAIRHVNLEPTTEVAVTHIGPQRPVQCTTLFSVKYARILVPNLRHSLDI